MYSLYENQKLSPDQIDRAIDERKYLDILFSYQTLTPEQMQYAIDNNIEIEFLYASPLTTKEQKKAIFEGVKFLSRIRIVLFCLWLNILDIILPVIAKKSSREEEEEKGAKK